MIQCKIQIEQLGFGDFALFEIQRERFGIQRTELFLDLVIFASFGFQGIDIFLDLKEMISWPSLMTLFLNLEER